MASENPPVCERCGDEYTFTEPDCDYERCAYCDDCAQVALAQIMEAVTAAGCVIHHDISTGSVIVLWPDIRAEAARPTEELDRLKQENAALRQSALMSCIEPADDCGCAGCAYAAEVHADPEAVLDGK